MRILIYPNERYMGQIVCFLIVNGGSRAGRLPGTPLWGKRMRSDEHTEQVRASATTVDHVPFGGFDFVFVNETFRSLWFDLTHF